MLVLALSLTAFNADAAAAGPEARTLRAWSDYVSATEARIHGELSASQGFLLTDFLPERSVTREALDRGVVAVGKMATTNGSGNLIAVPGGTITHWRGAVFLPGASLDALLHRLQHPGGSGARQEDVVSLRVLDRGPDRLRLAMRVRRTNVVTVSYDTEHVATYRRLSATRAASTSVSTRIAEVVDAGTASERVLREGEGRGFLWRMNSYWRYEETGHGVIVEVESLTLSRGIPLGLNLLVQPIIDRIARESMTRTLASVRRTYGTVTPAGAAH